LRELAKRCDVAAFLRFARAPYWNEPETRGTVIGDFRYDSSPELEFAEMELEPGAPRCPTAVPGWTLPRQDLLDGARPR
jgi:hypothetical protein